MSKNLFIAEKPSVAKEFAKALGETFRSGDGFMESSSFVVTWCVGHLVAMSYPEKYDPALKKWSLSSLPFIPDDYKYEVINGVKKQFAIVKNQLLRSDLDTIYVCTDSGREGEYIYRLVREQAGVRGKKEKRVWIDSQTEEEIIKGIKNAKDLSEYDNLSDSAYLRAKEDYLMGINFSRAMSLIYGNIIGAAIGKKYLTVAVGRVMTCVLGMIVKREREIRGFVTTPFYKLNAGIKEGFCAEWKVSENSRFFGSKNLYKDNGFLNKEDAIALATGIAGDSRIPIEFKSKGENARDTDPDATVDAEPEGGAEVPAWVLKVERKKEKKNSPLLYNLAELQNDCSGIFKISPEVALKIAQELYEKKLTTYPRTDARVLSKAVCKEITKNIKGIRGFDPVAEYAAEVMDKELYKGIEKTRYCDDKKITDHYAIIPTGAGLGNLKGLSKTAVCVYEMICRRFLSVFYPPTVYNKTSVVIRTDSGKGEGGTAFSEEFFANFKVLADEGYLKAAKNSFDKKGNAKSLVSEKTGTGDIDDTEKSGSVPDILNKIKKGDRLGITYLTVKESETTPPKRYNSGSMILAMENAGQLIEDEELREQIKGSGIGTSATRAGILEKLEKNGYINVNTRTQILKPAFTGEMIYDAVRISLKSLLSPELTASWEKGLAMVAEGDITAEEYMEKLVGFVRRRTVGITESGNIPALRSLIQALRSVYK